MTLEKYSRRPKRPASSVFPGCRCCCRAGRLPLRGPVGQGGFTVIEMLTVFSVVSILSGIVAYGFRQLDRPAENAALQTMGFLKKSRAKALGTTWAYTLTPAADGKSVSSKYGKNCSTASWTDDPKLTLNLPKDARITDTSWSICFTTRGLTSSSATIPIADSRGLTKQVMLAAGGGTKIQ